MSLRRSSRSAAAVVGLALASTACVSGNPPGLDVQALQADVVFGFEFAPEETPILPPSEVPAANPGLPPQIGNGTLTVPFRNKLPDRFEKISFKVPPPVVTCPSAGIGSSPSEAATETVANLPKEGLYEWKRKIEIVLKIEGTEIPSTTEGFESRVIRAVTELGEGTNPTTEDDNVGRFSYEVVRPDTSGAVVVDRWLVNTAPISRGVNVNQDPEGITKTGEGLASDQGLDVDIPDEAQESLPGGNRVRVGEPNRGLVLQQQQYFDGNGESIGQYSPSPPLLYLPLPVQAGDSWTSTGVDSRTGETRRIDGQVNQRQSVDACGTLIDGWLVELSETIASGNTTVVRTSNLVVSTNLGAIVIGEDIDETGSSADVSAEYHIGQVEPDPAPGDLNA